MNLNYCVNCLFPETKLDLSFNEKDLCSACDAADKKDKGIDWKSLKFDFKKITQLTSKPLVTRGGAGTPSHFTELISTNYNGALAAVSIYHFTQYAPQEVKNLE